VATTAAKGGAAKVARTSLLSKAGAAMPVIGASLLAAEGIYKTATADDKVHEGTKQAGKWGGTIAGAKMGAMVGQALIPIPGVGMLIGGRAGGIAARWGGEKIGNYLGEKGSDLYHGTGEEPAVDPEVKVKRAYTENLNTITSQEEKATTTEKLHAELMRED